MVADLAVVQGLEVTGIVVQLETRAGVSAGGQLSTGSQGSGVSLEVTASVADQPTINYVPSQGEPFVRRFLTPLTAETIVHLVESRWDFSLVARLCVQGLNRVSWADGGSTPGAELGRVADGLSVLMREGRVRLEIEPAHADASPLAALRLAPDAATDPRVQDVLRALELQPGNDHYPVVLGTRHEETGPPWTTLAMQTRSLFGVLSLLAEGVEVPEPDRAIAVSVDAATSQSVLAVHASSAPPARGMLAVPYRGHWFYVDDTDRGSRSTFLLVGLLYALQAAPPVLAAPALSLPIGR